MGLTKRVNLSLVSLFFEKPVNMKKISVLALSLLVAALMPGCKSGSQTTRVSSAPLDSIDCLFDTTFLAKTVTILTPDQARRKAVPFALVRNSNGKLAFMAKDDNAQLQPYYMRGIECGFWGMRGENPDYDTIFETYRKLGANASMFMIHWSDIEPRDGVFDFSFTDSILETAERHGIRIVWVLFMHEQFDMPFLTAPEDLWMYNLDTRDGENYAIQWIRDRNGEIVKDIPSQRDRHYSEIMPCYSNPAVYSRIIRMLGQLAAHYRDSESVIGVQIGNEEHFSYQGEDSDLNPYTLAAFDRWKEQTGESSWNRFKLDMVKRWFSRFTTAWHLQDPYKVTMINPIAGGPEKGETGIIDRSGTDATTFRDSKVDAIATMFYWDNGHKVWNNLDQVYKADNTYSYPTRLPLLMSTEIGIRNLHPWPYTQEYMTNFIERGSQGFAVYAYGHMASLDGEINEYGDYYRNYMSMVAANEDIIWPGLPGIGDNISITSTYGGGKVSCLHDGNYATLGILHFPDDLRDGIPEIQSGIPVEVRVNEPGRYLIEIYRDGNLVTSQSADLTSSRGRVINLDMSNKGAAFIKVKKQ